MGKAQEVELIVCIQRPDSGFLWLGEDELTDRSS
jgi:hypothetical protein